MRISHESTRLGNDLVLPTHALLFERRRPARRHSVLPCGHPRGHPRSAVCLSSIISWGCADRKAAFLGSGQREQDCCMRHGWSWPSGVTAQARSDTSHFMSSTKFLMSSDGWPGYAPTEAPGLNFGACSQYESPALPSWSGYRRARLLSMETVDQERGPSNKKISNQSVHPRALRTCRHRRPFSQGPCYPSTGRWRPRPPSACTAPPSAA